VWVELFITAIRGRDGNAVQLMHALVDVSERRKAQAGIERLVAALEQTVEMVVITDREGVVRYVNAAFEAVSGYASREVVGQHINRLPGSMEQKGVSAEVWQTLKSGSVWRGRLRSRAADGTWYEEEAVMSPVRDADGQITGFVAVKRDVTEQLRIQARLQQAQRLEAIGTLAGGVAHEINNPINGIINYAQLVQEKLDAPSELVQTCLQGIRDEGWRIAAIVRNLLRFAHEDAGRGAFAECGVGELVTRAVSLMETVMRHEHIQIGLDVPVEMPPVLCREQQIQQVLVNLLTNARDALNERFPEPDVDKRLEVACSSEVRDKETWVVITVSDWGAGVPEHVCEHLFEPFFTTKPPGVGTGLGLAITHAIVRDHGGEIGVESAPDGPTRFRVHLPVAGPSDTFHSGDVRG
jgi:PAS domain S-box-containing protein